ncbi:MAG: hypothetical protein AAFW87_10535 [Pseudomonadota bacterium]
MTNKGVGALGLMCRDNQPFLWTQGWAASKAGADRQESFTVVVDDRSFTVSGRHTPPDGLWTGVPSTDLINALKTGSIAVIEAPGEAPIAVSLRGSSRAIATAMKGCSTKTASPTPSTGDRRSVLFGQLIASACGGGYSIADGAELTGRLDNDDTPDLVLDWGGVTCDDRSKGRGAGFCGAALCTIQIAFTQTQTRQQILGVQPELVKRSVGPNMLRTKTQGATCGGATQVCSVVWGWNGTKLEPMK